MLSPFLIVYEWFSIKNSLQHHQLPRDLRLQFDHLFDLLPLQTQSRIRILAHRLSLFAVLPVLARRDFIFGNVSCLGSSVAFRCTLYSLSDGQLSLVHI